MQLRFSVPNATENIRAGRKTSTLRRYRKNKWLVHEMYMGWEEQLELVWTGDGGPYMIAVVPRKKWASEIVRLKHFGEDDLSRIAREEGFSDVTGMFSYLRKLYGFRFKSKRMIHTTWEAPA